MVTKLIHLPVAELLCSSQDYNNQVETILTQQSEYDIFKGTLTFLQNKTYPQKNPNGVYGAIYFENNDIHDKESKSQFSYFLRASNALIFSGCTPPESKYFSFVPYLMDRFIYNTTIGKYQDNLLFASLGDSLNNLLWNTRNNYNSDNYSYTFDSLTTVIQTSDNNTYNFLLNLLTSNGINNDEINLIPLPNKYINFLPYNYNNDNINNWKNNYDTGAMVMRITIPLNITEYNEYINTNQTVFMLQPKIENTIANNTTPKIPFNTNIKNTYNSNNYNEILSIYNSSIITYKHDLINYFKIKYNYTYTTEMIPIDFWKDMCHNDTDCYGYYCIARNGDCYGDNRDTLYRGSNIQVTNMYDDVYYIVLGIIHENSPIKQTIYSNIAYYADYYNAWNDFGDYGITNIEYNNSGLILKGYTNINQSIISNIYVVQMAPYKNCIDELAKNLCIQSIEEKFGWPLIRNYLNPITKTGPNLNQTILPTVLTFKTT